MIYIIQCVSSDRHHTKCILIQATKRLLQNWSGFKNLVFLKKKKKCREHSGFVLQKGPAVFQNQFALKKKKTKVSYMACFSHHSLPQGQDFKALILPTLSPNSPPCGKLRLVNFYSSSCSVPHTLSQLFFHCLAHPYKNGYLLFSSSDAGTLHL